MATKVVPLGGRVLVEPIEDSGTTKGGIVLPDMAKEKPVQGRVLEVGPGEYENGVFVEPAVQVGDVVVYSKYAGMDIKVGDKNCLVLRSHDLVVKVVETE